VTTTNTDRARAALLALPLLASTAVFGVQVTRASLLGYRVGTEVLEADAASERLATLVWRTRGALASAATRLRALRIRGTYSVTPSFTGDGRALVVVRVRVDSETDHARQDERAALVEAALSCRDAYLYASVEGEAVHVCG
jgi:hypothetical protein